MHKCVVVVLLLALSTVAKAAPAYLVQPQTGSHLCLDIADKSQQPGARVQLWTCFSSSNQIWSFSGQALQAYGTACLDVPEGKTQDGTVLQVWPCAQPNEHQRWHRTGKQLRWAGTNKCLDTGTSSPKDGTRMTIRTCNAGRKQQMFAFTELKSGNGTTTPGAPTQPSPSTSSGQASNSAVTQAGSFRGFPYISLDSFLQKHPMMQKYRQDCIDAAASISPAIPPILLAAVAMQESSGNASVRGGLMQFTWAPTWAYYGKGDLNNGRDALFAAARYFKDLLQDNSNDLSRSLRAYSGDTNPDYVAQISSWLEGGFPYGPGT